MFSIKDGGSVSLTLTSESPVIKSRPHRWKKSLIRLTKVTKYIQLNLCIFHCECSHDSVADLEMSFSLTQWGWGCVCVCVCVCVWGGGVTSPEKRYTAAPTFGGRELSNRLKYNAHYHFSNGIRGKTCI